jgi:hypothetical protein
MPVGGPPAYDDATLAKSIAIRESAATHPIAVGIRGAMGLAE